MSGGQFASYSQKREDVLLNRALAEVARGQYLEVGVAEVTSVTKALRDRGWSGVHAVPVAGQYCGLTVTTPTDNVLQPALETSTGPATLRQVWADNLNGDVHFLKIAAAGAELDVLKGADFGVQRPWIVVIEVIAGESVNGSAAATDELLAAEGYTRVRFDDINRFFVADERLAQLGPAFEESVHGIDVQPDEAAVETETTVESMRRERDDAVAALERGLRSAVAEVEAARSLAAESYQRTFELERVLAAVVAQSDDYYSQILGERRAAQIQLRHVYRSTSWRVTVPLRILRHPGRYLRRLFRR